MLDYRKQLLETEKNKLKKINLEILELEEKQKELKEEYKQKCIIFEKEAKAGINIDKYKINQALLASMLKKDEILTLKLKKANERKEAQRRVVIKFNQDVLILEKLKNKKVEEYNKELLKDMEKMIEEFITYTSKETNSFR